MRKFDWKKSRTLHSPQHWQWLFDNHNKDISVEQFIEGLQAIRGHGKGKQSNGNYSPNNLKKDYKYLKERFGFFV